MKTLLVAFACIPLLAACKKDEPVPVTTAPAVVAPADTSMSTPVDTTPPAPQATETAPAATATTPAPTADTSGTSATSGSSLAGATQGSGGGMYVVDKGDTLWGIAQKNGISHGDLAKWNNINDPRELQVGRELMLSAP